MGDFEPNAAGDATPGGGAPGVAGSFAPSLLMSKIITVPKSSTLTVPFPSSISRTSISPSRCPSASMNDFCFAGSGGLAGMATFISARLLPRIVVMPVRVILGGGGLLSSGRGGAGGGLRPKTFRSTIPWYGFADESAAVELLPVQIKRAMTAQFIALPPSDMALI